MPDQRGEGNEDDRRIFESRRCSHVATGFSQRLRGRSYRRAVAGKRAGAKVSGAVARIYRRRNMPRGNAIRVFPEPARVSVHLDAIGSGRSVAWVGAMLFDLKIGRLKFG